MDEELDVLGLDDIADLLDVSPNGELVVETEDW